MRWPPTLCWTAPKTINGNRHFQVKAYGGKNQDRWVDIFPTKNKKDITRISWEKLKSEWSTGTHPWYDCILWFSFDRAKQPLVFLTFKNFS